MLNEGGSNKVKRSTWEDFISRGNVWAKVTPNIPESKTGFRSNGYFIQGCFDIQCLTPGSETPNELAPDFEHSYLDPRRAIVARAYQIYRIGGKYTTSAQHQPATPGKVTWSSTYCNPFSMKGNCKTKRVVNPNPGIYRCDTLILDSYATSALSSWGYSIAASYHTIDQNTYENWRDKMNNLAYQTPRWPRTIINKLESFQ